MDKLFSCHDGCLAAALGRRNAKGKWELYLVSEVQGMGQAEYGTRMTDDEYDDLIPFNSTSGVSHIGVLVGREWRLIELRETGGNNYEWKVLG